MCFPYQHIPRILTPPHPTPHCLLSLSPQNMDEVKHIFTQLVKCVEHLHSKGVVHGDIKTLNLVRTGRPLPAVLHCSALSCAVLCLTSIIWLSVPCLEPFCPPSLLSSSLFSSTLSPYDFSSPIPTTPCLSPAYPLLLLLHPSISTPCPLPLPLPRLYQAPSGSSST